MTRWLGSLVTCLVFSLVSFSLAFEWNVDQWPEGNQAYTLELRQGDSGQVVTMNIVITDQGETYDVATTMTVNQIGISQSELGSAAYGGNALGMFALGPMAFYGPAFMMLPMMLGQEDISVREEPIRVMGMGSISMDRSETIAGFECVVVSFSPDNDPDTVMEFALAETLPFPCYSKYGSGADIIEIRLISAE